ncbi:CmcJ/NvfI family oxidoreductase [Actinomarinicola tropica]|uniref:Methyltransferase n=1 Tax=Actinomarinicola tropica TaxID=2789776 RepID=A0A5Q2RLD2_9ACTN|nr:CmcJ/NvfI family oxidoreductase [Actinomarinicola tropica]QGG96653.1 hypothetical protein GH723_16975 [Actinomarinicola tropica]
MGIFCRATLNYATGSGPTPIEVDIADGRSAGLPGWEECGFELVEHRSSVTDWRDDEQVAAVHHAEFEELARSMTGADVALVHSHIRRSPDTVRQHGDLSPITFVHSDFASGQEIVRNAYLLERPGSEVALERNGVTRDDVRDAARVVTLQLWRNVGPAKMDHPLAFCDARTVSVDEGFPIHVEDYGGTGATFDALAIRAPGAERQHAWYAYPEMQPHEAVAFRTYDTALVDRGQVWFTPHSAFHDPEVPIGHPARESIELRATCLYL